MKLRHIAGAAQAASCQVLFVGSSEPKRVWTALTGLRKVLTVGECDAAAEGGAIVNFVIEEGEEGNVRFEINTEAADLAKVRVSSRLLSLARLIKRSHS